MALPQDSLTDFDHLLTFAVQQEQAVNDDGNRRHEQAFQNFLHENHPFQTTFLAFLVSGFTIPPLAS